MTPHDSSSPFDPCRINPFMAPPPAWAECVSVLMCGSHSPSHTHNRTHAHTHTHAPSRTHTPLRTRTHTSSRTHTHTHTHTRTHEHTHTSYNITLRLSHSIEA